MTTDAIHADAEERAFAVLAHLSPIIAMLLTAGFLSWAGPLLVWLLARSRGEVVRVASATSFNFNVTVWIAMIVGWICMFTIILIPIGLILLIVPGIAQLVLSIVGAVKAGHGEAFRYPFQVPILH